MDKYYLEIKMLDYANSDNSDPTKSKQGLKDKDLYLARKRATDIIKKTLKGDIGGAAESAIKNKKIAKIVGGTLTTAGAVGTQFILNGYNNKYSYSGNSAIQNSRENTLSGIVEGATNIGAIAGMALFAGPFGAIAGILGAIGLKVASLNQQYLELNYKTST